jgi:adenosylhomocysteine nucleosidase
MKRIRREARRNAFTFVGAILLAVLWSGCAGQATGSSEPIPQTQGGRILIISAMQAELAPVIQQTAVSVTTVVAHTTVYLGTIGTHQVVLAQCGESVVNAALMTQAVLDRWPISHVIFTGIGGRINLNLELCDVVVPAHWVEYEMLYAAETSPGVYTPPWWFTEVLPPFGMMYPENVGVNLQDDVTTHVQWFDADPGLLDLAASIPGLYVGGVGMSGPTLVENVEYADYQLSTWGADSCDMESAAVAHVAAVNDVPFIIFRALSDTVGNDNVYCLQAFSRSADAAIALINLIP